MKKIIVLCATVGLVIMAVMVLIDFEVRIDQLQKSSINVDKMVDNPTSSVFLDYTQIATQYENLYQSDDASFTTNTYNIEEESLRVLKSYVGSGDRNQSQEAIANISALISLELSGVKTDPQIALEFFNSTNEQGLALNNPNTTTGNTFWYEIFANILFLWYYDVTKDPILEEATLSIYEQFNDLVDTLSSGSDNINFDKYTGYNFKSETAINNERWVEPDAAIAIALVLDYGYSQTNNQAYLDNAIKCLDYIDSLNYNPKYEILSVFGPSLSAKYNALYNTNYDISKQVMWEFDTVSDIRPGWAMMTGMFGEADIDGVVGSNIDFGGYGFSMNTFMQAIAMAPLAKYDASYNDMIGKYLYNTYSSLSIFYAGQLPKSNYTKPGVYEEENYVPYEGIKAEFNNQSGYVSGDPTEYGWAKSDLSIYGGSYAGIFGSLIKPTNIEQVFMFDLDATDFFSDCGCENYLIYNPFEHEIKVDLSQLNAFNLTSLEYENEVVIAAQSTVQILNVEDESKLKVTKNQVFYNNTLVSNKTNTVKIVDPMIKSNVLKLNVQSSIENPQLMQIYIDDSLIYTGDYITSFEFDNSVSNFSSTHYLTVKLSSGSQIISDTIDFDFGQNSTGNLYQYQSDSKFVSIDKLPGSIDKNIISENNPKANYGGVATEVITLDPQKQYDVSLDISDVVGSWSLQLHVLNDPINEYGYYLQGDTNQVGEYTYSLDQLLQQLPVNDEGLIEVNLWLIATGVEGSNFKLNSLEVNERVSNALTYDKIVFDADSITNLLINQPLVYYDYSQDMISLINATYDGGFSFNTDTYIAKSDSKFSFEFAGDLDYEVFVVNKTTGIETQITQSSNLVDVGVNEGDLFFIKVKATGGINDSLIIKKMILE